MYSATLTLYGEFVMERHGDTPEDAQDALGGVSGPGYAIETIDIGESE